MARVGTHARVRIDRRICLYCGHDGRSLQGDRGLEVFRCPSCGGDLYSRPPRTYAEMELLEADEPGLCETGSTSGPIIGGRSDRTESLRRLGRALERALILSMMLVLVILGAVVALGAAAGRVG